MDLFLKSRRSYKNISQHKSYFSDSKRINMLNIINHIQFSYYSSYILVQDANIHLLTLILKFLFSTDFIIKSYHKER